jgi:hypothetical protein
LEQARAAKKIDELNKATTLTDPLEVAAEEVDPSTTEESTTTEAKRAHTMELATVMTTPLRH